MMVNGKMIKNKEKVKWFIKMEKKKKEILKMINLIKNYLDFGKVFKYKKIHKLIKK